MRLVVVPGILLVPTAQAQTIADYSRAQRAVLENAIMLATARSAGLAASAPAIPASPAPMSPPAALPAPPARAMPEPPILGPRISGVFASAAGAITEVEVNGTPYLLAVGQAVPGTPWRVESVAVDRVVLIRREGDRQGLAAEPARRVYALPPLH